MRREEDRILAKMGVAAGEEWETLVPFALRDEPGSGESGRKGR